MGIFRINTMTEQKFLDLSADGKILSNELNLVDNDDIGRTNVPSYDLLKCYVHDLSTALKDLDLKIKDQTTIGELYDAISTIKKTFGTEYF